MARLDEGPVLGIDLPREVRGPEPQGLLPVGPLCPDLTSPVGRTQEVPAADIGPKLVEILAVICAISHTVVQFALLPPVRQCHRPRV